MDVVSYETYRCTLEQGVTAVTELRPLSFAGVSAAVVVRGGVGS